jgi:branched-chain amino acid transport system substrate-binding protein
MMQRSYLPTAGLILAVLGLAGWAVFNNHCAEGQVHSGLICVDQKSLPPGSVVSSPEPSLEVDPEIRFSRGDRVFFRGDGNLDRDQGVAFFQQKKYQQAINSFTQAVANTPNDPEARIYLNNARALKQTNPYTIAVVVPVESREDVAKEILRGVADAQIKFNDADGKDDRLLEVLIVDDAGNKEVAQQVAAQLAQQSNVLGVVGHNSSDTSLAALPEYEKAKLALISPTATSTKLKGNVFFRTLSDDDAAGKKLADYARKEQIKKVAIFYDSTSSYSVSLEAAFKRYFQAGGGTFVPSIDLADESVDREKRLKQLAESDQVAAAVLLPSVKLVPRAISVARANTQLPKDQRLRFLGGDALFDTRTLINGGSAVNGLVLVVSWVADTPSTQDYAEAAKIRWGGRVGWRTANSFDATQALIQSLSGKVTRSSVLATLRSLQLPAQETAGEPLKFEESGDRLGEPFLVEVMRGGDRPLGADYGFQSLR